MKHAQTIAMARGLLAEGRVRDVARMLEPLVGPAPEHVPDALGAGRLVLRGLLARVQLLRHGDPVRALGLLKPFEAATREPGEPSARAEGMLWLGWTHAWPHAPCHDDARALTLLDEAERIFRQEMNAAGRCWALLGQALAYFSIDEQPLMRRALREADALGENLHDVQAALWTLDLHTLAAQEQGRYAQALACAEALAARARHADDPFAQGRAHAYQAALYADLGRPPSAIVEAAVRAEVLLNRAAAGPDYWLATTLRARLRAEFRSGAWPAARRRLDAALETPDDLTAASLLPQRAWLDTAQGRFDEAEARLINLDARLRRLPHRLPASEAALAWSALRERQHRWEEARTHAERAVAREAGQADRRLRALLCLARIALAQGDPDAARRYLAATQPFSDFFSVLPVAALRLSVLGELALAEETPEEARSYYDQARAAYTLVGDVYRVAQLQVHLAALDRTLHPDAARTWLEAAHATFERLEAHPDRDAAQALLDAWPATAAPAPDDAAPDIGAARARAAFSVDLVAETWLKAAQRLLPDRWLGLYRCDEGRPWMQVRAHGDAPAPPPRLAEPCSAQLFADGILWLRLRGHPGPAFFFGVALDRTDDPAWQAAHARIKPWMPVAALALDHALLRAERLDEPDGSDAEIPLKDVVYASPAMRELARQMLRIRASSSPVLLTGERGAGKHRLARALHALSERHDAPFVRFDAAGMAETLLERALFGGETGPVGALHAADGGTLFFDEVGDLPPEMQRRLLRFLHEGAVLPAGAREPVRLNVRVVAATSRDLKALIRAGRFAEDLYDRLHVISLHVPPLRERREEIPLLARHFLDALRPPGTPLPTLTHRALDALLRYDWPGNVRQLRNEIERALVPLRNEPAPLIDVKDLSPAIAGARGSAADLPPAARSADRDLDRVLADTEKALIERVLAEHDGQVTASANALGLTRQGLYKKMKRLGIDAARFHPENA